MKITSRHIEMTIAALIFGGLIGVILGMSSDYRWSLSLQDIRMNSDIFMNQYLGMVLLLCVAGGLYAGFRLIKLFCSCPGKNRS